MSNVNLNQLAENLRKFGLSEFVREYYDYLYNKTAHPNNFGRELLKLRILINESELATCTNPAGGYDKNEKLYEIVVTKDDPDSFLLALRNSNNDHIIDFIAKQLQTVPHDQNPAPSLLTSSEPRPEIAFNTDLATSVTNRLTAYLEEIKSRRLGEQPFYTFSRCFTVELYEITDYSDKLIFLLTQEKVLPSGIANEIRLIPGTDRFGRGSRLYDIIKIKGISCIPKFIKALDDSDNSQVIELLDEQLKKNGK